MPVQQPDITLQRVYEQLKKLRKNVEQFIGTDGDLVIPPGIPSGSITAFGGSAAPDGWLLCDGSAVSRSDYADLFAIIGTTYGAGDGSTTFNLPNLQQRFPLGKAAAGTGSTLGATGGAIDHTHVYTQVPTHNHGVTDSGHAHSVSDPTHAHGVSIREGAGFGSQTGRGSGAVIATDTTNAAATGISIFANTTGISIQNAGVASPSTQASNPPFLALNFIIKT